MSARKLGGIAAVAGMALIAVAALAQQAPKQDPKMEHSAAMQECAKICSDSQRACDSGATHCAKLLSEGKKEHLAAMMACQDSATISSACAEICARGGPFSAMIAEVCAKACADCATACEKVTDDEHMKECAEECRRCEKSCKTMATEMGRR